jgi:hypothetical protein
MDKRQPPRLTSIHRKASSCRRRASVVAAWPDPPHCRRPSSSVAPGPRRVQCGVDPPNSPDPHGLAVKTPVQDEYNVELVDVGRGQVTDRDVAKGWLEVSLDDRREVAHRSGRPPSSPPLEPHVEEFGHRGARPDRRPQIGASGQCLELAQSVSAIVANGPGQPAPLPVLGSLRRRPGARSNYSPAGVSNPWRHPLPQRCRDGQTARSCVAAEIASSQLRGKIFESGRRDSNPRPSPWQGGGFRLGGRTHSPVVLFCPPSFQAVYSIRACSRALYYRRNRPSDGA